jgi:hypothetical protein
MQPFIRMALAAVLVVCTLGANAQDPKADLQKKLDTLFILTKVTADNTDIVKPGSILELKKDGLVMYGVANKVAPTFTYKDGKFSMGFTATMSADMQLGMAQQGINHQNVPQRKFVAGEKFWVVSTAIKDDGVVVLFYSDPYDNVRYFGQVKFPFAKKTIPASDDLVKAISEVVTVQPADEGAQSGPAAPSAPDAPPQQIAPPPPPPDAAPAQPKTVSLGQTKDMVVAILGQPGKVAILGAKEIDYYPDMKVIFVNGKVTDIQ